MGSALGVTELVWLEKAFGSDGLSVQFGRKSFGFLLNIKFNPLNEISHLQTYETTVRTAATLYLKKSDY